MPTRTVSVSVRTMDNSESFIRVTDLLTGTVLVSTVTSSKIATRQAVAEWMLDQPVKLISPDSERSGVMDITFSACPVDGGTERVLDSFTASKLARDRLPAASAIDSMDAGELRSVLKTVVEHIEGR